MHFLLQKCTVLGPNIEFGTILAKFLGMLQIFSLKFDNFCNLGLKIT